MSMVWDSKLDTQYYGNRKERSRCRLGLRVGKERWTWLYRRKSNESFEDLSDCVRQVGTCVAIPILGLFRNSGLFTLLPRELDRECASCCKIYGVLLTNPVCLGCSLPFFFSLDCVDQEDD